MIDDKNYINAKIHKTPKWEIQKNLILPNYELHKLVSSYKFLIKTPIEKFSKEKL
jgi:hypothetical protein